MSGIIAYGTYVPYWRLSKANIAVALGSKAIAGTRAVASYDEDTTTMAVEAARISLTDPAVRDAVNVVTFSSSSPAYNHKTNATAVHAALSLSPEVRCSDAGGATRSGLAALANALDSSGTHMVTMAEISGGPVGSLHESGGGDAAAAFVVSDDPAFALAELISSCSVSEEFLDTWRQPHEKWTQSWEERFGEQIYVDLAARSFRLALSNADLKVDDLDLYVVTGRSSRAARRFAAKSGVPNDRIADDFSEEIGNAGTAHPGVVLAGLLDRAEPGQLIALTFLADGADTLIFRTTERLADARPTRTLRTQIDSGNPTLSYADFLLWTGHLTRQAPRRPDPDRATAPPSHRLRDWKFGFVGSVCDECSTRHLPPQQVCLRCGSTGKMSAVPLADTPGTIATYTIDHLAFSPAPPVVGVVLDFDGGGRFACELTDVDPNTVDIGQRVRMTFRRISETAGVYNYFWKACPLNEGQKA